MASIFKKGYTAVEEETVRIKKAEEARKNQIFRFFMTADEKTGTAEAEGRFLTEEPVTFYEHGIKIVRNGKESFDTVLCTGDDDLCQAGDKPAFKGAYLYYDYRTYTDKKDGKEKVSGLRLYVQGSKVLSQLKRIHEKYGLSNRRVTIIRTGSGTGTSYVIEKGDEEKLTVEEITKMLPEKLRPLYNGTQESLMTMVERCLEGSLPDDDDNKEDESAEEGVSTPPTNKNTIGVDDKPTPKDEDAPPVTAPKKVLFRNTRK